MASPSSTTSLSPTSEDDEDDVFSAPQYDSSHIRADLLTMFDEASTSDSLAMIARRVKAKEISEQPKAQDALNKEKVRLEAVPVWDVNNPVSWSAISAEARANGTKAFIGDIMPLVYQKHSELPDPDDPLKVYKGRIVFRGDGVKDESGALALFSEQDTSASHMAAAKFLDAIGCVP